MASTKELTVSLMGAQATSDGDQAEILDGIAVSSGVTLEEILLAVETILHSLPSELVATRDASKFDVVASTSLWLRALGEVPVSEVNSRDVIKFVNSMIGMPLDVSVANDGNIVGGDFQVPSLAKWISEGRDAQSPFDPRATAYEIAARVRMMINGMIIEGLRAQGYTVSINAFSQGAKMLLSGVSKMAIIVPSKTTSLQSDGSYLPGIESGAVFHMGANHFIPHAKALGLTVDNGYVMVGNCDNSVVFRWCMCVCGENYADACEKYALIQGHILEVARLSELLESGEPIKTFSFENVLSTDGLEFVAVASNGACCIAGDPSSFKCADDVSASFATGGSIAIGNWTTSPTSPMSGNGFSGGKKFSGASNVPITCETFEHMSEEQQMVYTKAVLATLLFDDGQAVEELKAGRNNGACLRGDGGDFEIVSGEDGEYIKISSSLEQTSRKFAFCKTVAGEIVETTTRQTEVLLALMSTPPTDVQRERVAEHEQTYWLEEADKAEAVINDFVQSSVDKVIVTSGEMKERPDLMKAIIAREMGNMYRMRAITSEGATGK